MSRYITQILFLLLCCLFTATAQQIPYGNNPTVGRYATINGVKHYYEVYGEGEPILLIHGNSTGIPGWAAQIDYFAKRYKVYAIDCRGRGKSEMGKDTLTYSGMAADMAAFILQMKLDKVDIIGKSDGAIVALLMGMYFPQRINKIVSFGANLWPGETALYGSARDLTLEREHADSMLAKGDKTQNWYMVQQRTRLMEFQPHIKTTDLDKIHVPVLVMSCDRDLIKEDHTMLIYHGIPMASLCILPGENHWVSRQNAMLFNTTIDTFFTRPFRDEEHRFKR